MEQQSSTSKAGEIIGIIGFSLSLLTIPILFIPCIGFIGIIPAVIAFILCIVSIVLNRKNIKKAILPIIGGGILLISVIFMFIGYAYFTNKITDFADEFESNLYNEMDSIVDEFDTSNYNESQYIDENDSVYTIHGF